MAGRIGEMGRRRLLWRAAALAGASLTPAVLAPRAFGKPGQDDPFTLGVASGEPAPDGVVIWTRLAPRPLEPNGGMAPESVKVRWEVAEDPGFRTLAARGDALAGPAAGHSVHVEVGGLRPGREYWYRFTTATGSSPIGRTVTAPPAGTEVEMLKLAFGSCQKYEAGFYGAYRHMVEDRPDLFLFLGDYIYEKDPNPKNAVRLHQNPEPMDVAGYRVRYATYKTDPLLQAAHQVAPWMVIWDDHEVDNDYGDDVGEEFNAEFADGAAGFLRRRAAAYQAYYEHLPLRRRSKPVGPDMLLYRTLDWGRLAQFQFLDDRQYRSHRVCMAPGGDTLIPDCDDRRDPARSLLGQTQEAWLMETLSGSKARWNMLAQQTLFAPLARAGATPDGPTRFAVDGWDGAPATRDRIVQRWREANVANPVVLGGDIHTFAAAEVSDVFGGKAAAPCFVGGSISSLGGASEKPADILKTNPHVKLYDNTVRGYGRVEIGRERTEVTFRAMRNALEEKTEAYTRAAYVVEDGVRTVQEA